ncbi:zinc finger protein [Culex quinquefasciatus]|uniref:Zinc finger protein n=1 Tax=Culex quinquefasciatus TaxID=7176 RepID=B0WW22_CULQU|nr:zinc finger protein [Culex quinquefasciatus]|eukprot:XP_001861594.1 zinc finger protein [Culex quinquefasciatus]
MRNRKRRCACLARTLKACSSVLLVLTQSKGKTGISSYIMAQLEAEIENLSWKVERAETTDRGDLENQMDVAEKRRTTLLKDFFPTEA